jgi:hypothetical protein
MNRMRIWASLATMGLATALAAAQSDNPAPQGARRADVPNAGFWPTQRMVESAIERITEELGKVYSLDEDQMLNTQDLLKQRFPRWMEENRAQLQTLGNQWVEAMISSEPPTPEQVADWAARCQPLLQEFSVLADETSADMRMYMTDEQQVLLDGQLAAMHVGINYMQQRMETWKAGGYDWKSEWPRSEEFKRQEPERRKRLEQESERQKLIAMGIDPGTAPPGGGGAAPPGQEKPPTPPKPTGNATKDDWTVYVENFIKRYQLDEGQQNNARKYLRDGQELRDKHLTRKLTEIRTLEEKQKSATTDEEKEKVRVAFERINRPVEQMFEQLKIKLDKLPTRKQRAAAGPDESSATALKSATDARAQAPKVAEAEKPKPDNGAKQ